MYTGAAGRHGEDAEVEIEGFRVQIPRRTLTFFPPILCTRMGGRGVSVLFVIVFGLIVVSVVVVCLPLLFSFPFLLLLLIQLVMTFYICPEIRPCG